MVVAVTGQRQYSGDIATGSQTADTASFTPPANSLLVVTAWVARAFHTTAFNWPSSPAGGSLTYSLRHTSDAWAPYGSDTARQGRLWTAPVGASPASMTVTLDAFTGTPIGHYGANVFAVTGHDPAGPVAQVDSNAATTEPLTLTLPSAPSGPQAAVFFNNAESSSVTWDADPANWATVAGGTSTTQEFRSRLLATATDTDGNVQLGSTNNNTFYDMLGFIVEFVEEAVGSGIQIHALGGLVDAGLQIHSPGGLVDAVMAPG